MIRRQAALIKKQRLKSEANRKRAKYNASGKTKVKSKLKGEQAKHKMPKGKSKRYL